jgi:hypothetical protein
MVHIGSDLDQRFENKAPLMHGRVRNFQARFLHRAIPKEHDIDIDVAWSFFLHAETPHLGLDLQDELEQFLWGLFSIDGDHAVQKPRLVWEIDGLGFI